MKKFKFLSVLSVIALGAMTVSCENSDIDFPDYEGGVSVYFAYQNPIRTIVLGTDHTTDVTLDNQHKCKIISTMGGAYNGRNINVNIAVDPSLVNNLYFEDGSPVKVLPENYYSLSTNTLSYNGGMQGATEVTLNDAFFADPASLKNTYVIPVKMTSQTGADSILVGKELVAGENPQLSNTVRWDPAPKNYVLYLVKYINKYTGTYLRLGDEKFKVNGKDSTATHGNKDAVEKYEVVEGITSHSLTAINYPVTYTNGKLSWTANLIITFNENGEARVELDPAYADKVKLSDASAKYLEDAGTWNNIKRQGFELKFKLEFNNLTVESSDKFVLRDRAVPGIQEFKTTYKNN